MVGVGYRPRTGTVFFTRNGKKLEDVAHGLKTQNLFPSIGANGPCTVHVNFGQMGFVFIEANVKKWGLAPMTGSLAPPPPYGSEQGSILLEAAREGGQNNQGGYLGAVHSRGRSGTARFRAPTSPGPARSPTDISLAQLEHVPSNEDPGEGTSAETNTTANAGHGFGPYEQDHGEEPPPDYESPEDSDAQSPDDGSDDEQTPMLGSHQRRPPIPSYDSVVGNDAHARHARDTSRL